MEITFVGTLTATVTNEVGETFTRMMSDVASKVFGATHAVVFG